MPRREDWVKAHTRYLHDDRLLSLSAAQRGLYWSMYLLAGSDATESPGLFIRDDEPMSADAIAYAIHQSTPTERAGVREALARLVDVGLMAHEDATGWRLSTWEKDQSGIKADVKRTAARLRKRRSRAAARTATAAPTPITDYME